MESEEKKAMKDTNSLLLEIRMTKHKELPQVKNNNNNSLKLFKLCVLSL